MVPDRSKSRIALFTALLIMAILPLAPAGAVETVGTVVAVRGEAFAVNQQEESRRLTLKSPIHRMDTLKTRQGRIQLMFQDTTLITLGQNSEMVIKEYLWRPDQEYGAMTTKVKEGTFRIMGGAITRTAPRNFKTETPSATIGIRGSMYAGMVKGDTLMIVFQGGHGIYVMNGQGYVNITRPGFGTRIKGAGLAPSKPKRFTSGDLDNIEGALEIRVHKGKKTARAAESQVPRKPEKKPPPAKAPPPGKGPGETTTIAENVTTTVSDNSQESTAGNVKPPTDEEPPPSDEEPPPPDEEPPPPDEEPPPPDEEPPPPDEEPPPPDEEPPPPDEEPPPPDEEPPPPDEEPPPPDEEPPPPDEEPPPPDEEPPPPDEEPPPPDEEPPPPDEEPPPPDEEPPPPDEEPPPDEDPTPPSIVSLLDTLGFSGELSASTPDNGAYAYKGVFKEEATEQDGLIKGLVNWHSKRFLLTTKKTATGPSGVNHIFGEVTPEGKMANVTIIGSGFDPLIDRVSAFKGSSTFGHFYGSGQEALGLTMSGINVDVQDQSVQEPWTGIGAAVFEETIPYSDTGTVSYSGFFIGLAEDMAGPDINKRLFANQDPNDFTMTVNRDDGTVSGFLSGTDAHHPGNEINALQIGGSDKTSSAFITDKDMIAVLTGANAITTPTGTAGLKEYGNFMISAREEMLSAHTSWGYWELAYKEPGTERDYHLHIPGAMWMTGERTPESVVAGLISTNFSGTYTGGARGIGIDDKGTVEELVNGKTNLSIDFAPQSTMPVSGTLTFDQVTLNVMGTASGAVTDQGFNATIDGSVEGRVNGAFYGPSAEGIGGNFNADMGDMKYHGIFAGDR